jgi:hypothetical protein
MNGIVAIDTDGYVLERRKKVSATNYVLTVNPAASNKSASRFR